MASVKYYERLNIADVLKNAKYIRQIKAGLNIPVNSCSRSKFNLFNVKYTSGVLGVTHQIRDQFVQFFDS